MNRLLVAAVAALSLGLAACDNKDEKADATTITIGVAGPITGSEAVFGEQFVHGAKKAVADINAAGGVLGKQLVLEIGDDACDPKQAVSVANDMASKGAVFVAGSSIPASDVYAESNIIQITPASTNPDFTERGLPNTFRVCGRDDAQGPTAAEYVVAHFGGKRVAVVDDKSTYGQGLANEFSKALNGAGVEEVLHRVSTRQTKSSLANSVRKITSPKPIRSTPMRRSRLGPVRLQRRAQQMPPLLKPRSSPIISIRCWVLSASMPRATWMRRAMSFTNGRTANTLTPNKLCRASTSRTSGGFT